MDAATRLRQALDHMPDGSLVPVSWIRGVLEEDGGGDRLGDYTVAAVAGILGKAESTVRTMIGDGRLRAYKLGKEWRVTAEAIKELRNGSDEKPTARDADADLGSWRELAK